MKVTRLVIGIISFVMALIVTFQSCFAGLGNAMEDNGEVGGSAGVVLAVFAIVAGIIAIVTRKGEGKGPVRCRRVLSGRRYYRLSYGRKLR